MTSSLLPGFPVPSRPCRSARSGLRAADGSVNIIPFSVVTTINNTSRGIGNATISVTIPYDEDIDRVDGTLKEIVGEMRKDPAFDGMIRSDLQMWGLDKVSASGVTIVGKIECTDAGRWPVQREFQPAYARALPSSRDHDRELLRPEATNGSFLEHKRHIRIAARRNLAEVVLQPFAALHRRPRNAIGGRRRAR